jgi:hypothetical protein
MDDQLDRELQETRALLRRMKRNLALAAAEEDSTEAQALSTIVGLEVRLRNLEGFERLRAQFRASRADRSADEGTETEADRDSA